jgi:hypothetical protein
LLLVAAALSGCLISERVVIPSPSGFTPPAKPSTCRIDFFWTTPDRPYEELAAVGLSASGLVPPDVVDDAREVMRAKACELGGDAVVVLQPFSFLTGIVVKYRDLPNPAR